MHETQSPDQLNQQRQVAEKHSVIEKHSVTEMQRAAERIRVTERIRRAQQLQTAIRDCEGTRANFEEGVFSSGCEAIDRLLPQHGLRNGMLVEWLAKVPGSAAALLGLINCREACQQESDQRESGDGESYGRGEMLVVIDRQQNFYPPVAVAWGIRPQQMIVVHPATQSDHVWALVQALESPAVTAVWSVVDRIDSKTYQRVRLAAQTGNTLGVLLRPADARGQPSWADVQFWVNAVSNPAVAKKGVAKGADANGAISPGAVSTISPETVSTISPRTVSKAPISKECVQIIEVVLARCRGAKAGGSTVLKIDATHAALSENFETRIARRKPRSDFSSQARQ